MKNTRGFLLAEETLKIIIAVICLALLAYFLVSVYLKSSEDEDLELAKASLEHLISEAGTGEVEVYNPDGWVLSSWSSPNAPASCENLGWKNCLCICDEDVNTLRVKGLAKDCDDNGYCLESALEVKGDRTLFGKAILENSIKIEPPLKLKITDGLIT